MWKTAVFTVVTAALGMTTIAVIQRADQSRTMTFDAFGVVRTAPERGRIRISHDDIPGYMPAMTMEFVVGEGNESALAPGDRVRFALRIGPDRSWIENVEVTGRTRMPGLAPASNAPVRLRKGDAIPPLSLVDQDGQPLTASDFNGRLTVLTFIFTRCPVPDYCPLLSRRFSQIQAALATGGGRTRDVRLLSVTIDPIFDTPPVLKAYAQAIGADPSRWRFAGGDSAEITRLARAFSVYVERNGALLDHTLATALVDRTGHIVDIWRGNGWKTGELLDAIRQSDPNELPPDQ
jgi:protein SCO1/2